MISYVLVGFVFLALVALCLPWAQAQRAALLSLKYAAHGVALALVGGAALLFTGIVTAPEPLAGWARGLAAEVTPYVPVVTEQTIWLPTAVVFVLLMQIGLAAIDFASRLPQLTLTVSALGRQPVVSRDRRQREQRLETALNSDPRLGNAQDAAKLATLKTEEDVATLGQRRRLGDYLS